MRAHSRTKITVSFFIWAYFNCYFLSAQKPFNTPLPETEDPISIVVRLAKSNGKTEVKLDSVIVLETGISTVDELTKEYDWLRFRVLEISTTRLEGRIATWYKIKIGQSIKWGGFSERSVSPARLPRTFQLNGRDEGFIIQSGGMISVDGVKVEQPLSNTGFTLKLDQEYVGSFYTGPNSYHLIPASGNSSIFELSSGKLTSIGPGSHPLSKSMQNVYQNDYQSLVSDVEAHFPKAKSR